MPSLYGNVSVGNTIGLYQQSSGTSQVLTNAQSLLSLLSNASTVGFSLTAANTQVQASVQPTGVTSGTYGNASLIPVITVGGDGRVTSISTVTNPTNSYGNANVTALLNGSVTIGNLTVRSGIYWANGQPYTSPQLYGNANVASFLGNFGSNSISTTGNVTAGNVLSNNYLYANGVSILTGVTGTYSNANVAAYMPVYGGDIRAGTVAATVALTAPTLANNSGSGLTITAGGSNLADLGLLASGNVNINPNQGTGSNKGINLNYNTYTNYPFNISSAIYSSGGYYWANNVPYSATVQGLYGDSNVAAYLATHPQAGSYGNANVAAYLPTYVGAIGDQYANIQINTTNIGGDGNIITTGNGVTIQTWNSIRKQNGPSNAIDIIANGANDVLQLTGNSSVTIASGNNILISPPIGLFSTYTGTILTVQGDASVQEIRAGSGGNLTVAKKFTAGNIITTNGVFWANGAVYSTGSTGSSFTGNLAGSTLFDSVNGRILANAYPQSDPGTQPPLWQNIKNNPPVYVNGVLQPAAATGVNGLVNQNSYLMQTVGNVGLQSSYQTTTTRFTNGILNYQSIWPVTANVMQTTDRYRHTDNILEVNLNGITWASSQTQTNQTVGTQQNFLNIYGNGTLGTAGAVTGLVYLIPEGTALGSGLVANVNYVTGITGQIQSQTTYGSTNTANVIYARGFLPQVAPASNSISITNAIGLHTPSGWVTAPNAAGGGAITNRYAILNEDANSLIQTNANIVFATGSGKSLVFGDGTSMSTAPVTQIVAGTNVTISPAGGTGVVTINANTQPGTYANVNVSQYLPHATGYTDGWQMPIGGNSARPSFAGNGMIRYNTDTLNPEWYNGVNSTWYNFSQAYTIPPPTITAWYVVVGGGGGSGGSIGGGGGAGGYLEGNVTLTSGTTYTVAVGAGGAGVSGQTVGNNGTNSSISGLSLTALGGGGGGSWDSVAPANGASGGGGHGGGSANWGYGTGTVGQGNNGGAGYYIANLAGGGGGATAVGADGNTGGNGGDGGNGATTAITGSSTSYAGGGGGGANNGSGSSGGAGGLGGGGGGGYPGGAAGGAGTSGTVNTGGGGGGGTQSAGGSSGGSGVVIIRVLTSQYTGTTTGSPTVTTTGSYTVMTFTGSGSYTA